MRSANLRLALASLLAIAASAMPEPASAGNDDFPAQAGSWGGVVRDGPGKQYKKVDSLKEGEPVTLMGRSEMVEDGYPWFKIIYWGSRSGYQWGGILCAIGPERPDLFQTCPPGTANKTPTKAAPNCPNGGEWDGLRCRPAGFFAKAKKCPKGEYLNQLGQCQPNETGQ